jgi:hypothetical protein
MARIPRIPKSGPRRPETAEAHKKKWQNPEYRERMLAARARAGQENSERYSRLGVPSGMHRAEAVAAWAEANKLTEHAMRGLEAQGLVPATVIPDSDEAKAKAVLHQAVLIALGPGNAETKLLAIRIVLRFTRPPQPSSGSAGPATTTADDWLRSIIAVGQAWLL